LKYLRIIFIFLLFTTNVDAQKIGTFKFSLILQNLESYKNFMIKLDDFKKKKFEELRNQENLLVTELKEIEDSKILLSEIEYLSRISKFEEDKKNFENKVNNLNKYITENIEFNENKILKETIEIVKKIAIKNNIDIIFYDDQYFLSSDNIDISGLIFNDLNQLNLSLELNEYEQ